MNREQLKQLTKNRIFSATFIKKNGEIRKMLCRTGVKKFLKGGEKSYNDDEMNHITVYDLKKKAYRTINLNTLTQIKSNGKEINL